MAKGVPQTPLLRVSRPVAACSRCRLAKVKCDGKLPACTACEKNGRQAECANSNDEFAKGKERSYVASLEARLEKLEKKLDFAIKRRQSVAMHKAYDTVEEPASRKDSYAIIRHAVNEKDARRREASDVDDLVADFGSMSVNAVMVDPEKTTSMTFATLILTSSTSEKEKMPTINGEDLPSRPAANALMKYYLENVHALFPAFSETSLYTAINTLYQKQPLDDFQYWVVFMVFGIGATGQSRSRNDISYKHGVAWVARALTYADRVLVPDHISQMPALILLIEYSMLDPAHFDAWQLIGYACRAVVELGYHQDPPKDQMTEKHVLDQRRRLFYSVYSLDRSISMMHSRPFSFVDDATSVALPEAPATGKLGLEGPTSVQAALSLFRLRKMQSAWYQDLHQSSREDLDDADAYIWRKYHEMQVWADGLPENLSPAIRNLFELEVLYSYVCCSAPSTRVKVVSRLGESLIFKYGLEYIDKILPISNDPVSTGFYTYLDVTRVNFVGHHLLLVLQSSPDRILGGVEPQIPLIPGVAPQRLTQNNLPTNLRDSITCINHTVQILKTYGERWSEYKSLSLMFEINAAPVLTDLRRRQEMISNSAPQTSPGAYRQYSQPNQHDSISPNWYGLTPLANRGSIENAGLMPQAFTFQDPQMMTPASWQESTDDSSPRTSSSYHDQSSPPLAYQLSHQNASPPLMQTSPRNSYYGQPLMRPRQTSPQTSFGSQSERYQQEHHELQEYYGYQHQ